MGTALLLTDDGTRSPPLRGILATRSRWPRREAPIDSNQRSPHRDAAARLATAAQKGASCLDAQAALHMTPAVAA